MTFDTILEIGDAMVAIIAADWQPTGDDEVELTFLPGVAKPDAMEGRKVWIVPVNEEQVDGGTRALDRNSYTLALIVAERFTSATNIGKPTTAWTRERIKFVTRLAKKLSRSRTTATALFPSPLNDVLARKWNQEIEVDFDLLREKSIFFAQTNLTYERDEAEDGA